MISLTPPSALEPDTHMPWLFARASALSLVLFHLISNHVKKKRTLVNGNRCCESKDSEGENGEDGRELHLELEFMDWELTLTLKVCGYVDKERREWKPNRPARKE